MYDCLNEHLSFQDMPQSIFSSDKNCSNDDKAKEEKLLWRMKQTPLCYVSYVSTIWTIANRHTSRLGTLNEEKVR